MGLGRYLDGCGNCMKYSLFFVNLLIFLGGLVIIGLGVYTLVDKPSGKNLVEKNDLYIGVIIILIVAAVIVSLIACFGCFGAVQEVRCMLLTYFILVFLVFVTMLVGGILLYVFRHKAEPTVKSGMEKTMRTYDTNTEAKEAWDEIQTFFHCCGIHNHTDWIREIQRIPDTCCEPTKADAFNRCYNTSPNLYREGCFELWPDFIKKNAAIVGGVGIGLACVMILGMVFSCALFNLID